MFETLFDALERLTSATRDHLDAASPSTLASDVRASMQAQALADLKQALDRAEYVLRQIDEAEEEEEEDEAGDDGDDFHHYAYGV